MQQLTLVPCRPPPHPGHVACAELLLEAGADANDPCDGCPPLHMAVCTAQLPGRAEAAHLLVQRLLEAGALATDWWGVLGLAGVGAWWGMLGWGPDGACWGGGLMRLAGVGLDEGEGANEGLPWVGGRAEVGA